MPRLDIDEADTSDYKNIAAWSAEQQDTDGVEDQKETTYVNEKWQKYWGIFNSVPELQNAILMKGIWNTGKGWTADGVNKAKLDLISGWGKDTWDDIIFNMDVMSMINGDSYAEIIRQDGRLINLKPLNPGTIKIVVDSNGRIKHYEQWMKKVKIKKIARKDMFHLCFNRLADQIHGISKIESMLPIIEADQQSFEQMNNIMRFQAHPFIIFKMKTDNTTKISNFKAKVRDVRKDGDDLFIPDDENLLSWEVVQISPSQVIMNWRDDLRNKFYRAFGLPQIVPGGGEKGTGSESRTIYLAFEQLVAQRQLYLEKQIWTQLAIRLKFNPPTTMAELIGKTENKTAAGGLGAQPSEVNAAAERQ